jgi:hypothetical protein
MLKSYFRITWRNLLKDRQFTALNLIGLSVGLACTLLIGLWVADELHMDRYNEKDAQLYQVMGNFKTDAGIKTGDKESLYPVILPVWRSLLSREFLALVFLSICIAFPLVYLGMHRWLDSFAYRTSIKADVFVLTGLAALTITLLTIGYQALKAASMNPVETLRSE